ncbi:hypothetical protein D210916BOD24_23460 [Alteromonas sp. D210916BOD_24]|uniref:hypothetical protein n=1 Tax=Alteromonas sp. D210916BOD_24 TaxID=3157618 RepID=UPI00399D5315
MPSSIARFIFVCSIFLFIICSPASANVALSKFRIFFDAHDRSNSLQLRNTGAVDVKYTAEIALNAMTEDGAVYAISEDPFDASAFLRFSPKRGVIQPGERQAIRFALRKPAGLADGEYRAVIRLTTELAPTTGGNVNLASKLAYNVPIIVRHGELVAESTLESPTTVIHNGMPAIQVWQTRHGNRSLYGNFIVQTLDGEELGVLNNVAAYRPLERRKVLIPLQKVVKGPVTINYIEDEKFGGNIELSIEHIIQ